MDNSTTKQDAERSIQAIEENLDAVELALRPIDEEVRRGTVPTTHAIVQAMTGLDPVLEHLAVLVEAAQEWPAGVISLERRVAVVEENWDLARLARENLDAPAPALDAWFWLRDAVFHARRAVEQSRAALTEMVRETRATDRLENQREFMNG